MYKLVGAGSFGCVVTPVPACEEFGDGESAKEGGDDDAIVAKLCTNKGGAAHELWMASRVRAVDPHSTFTLLPYPRWCRVPERDIPDLCRPWWVDEDTGKPRALTTPFVYRLTMPFGGKPILRTSPKEGSVEAVAVVLQGLLRLAEVGIVHSDIHKNNVLIDEEGVIRIIDFGEGFVTSDFRKISSDLVNFMTIMRNWFDPVIQVDAAVASKFKHLLNDVKAPQLRPMIYSKLMPLWAGIWDAHTDLSAFRAILGTFEISRIMLAPQTELDALYAEVYLELIACCPGRYRRAEEGTCDALMAAWDELLAEYAGGRSAVPSDALLHVYTVIYGVAAASELNAWSRLALLAPLCVGAALQAQEGDTDQDFTRMDTSEIIRLIRELAPKQSRSITAEAKILLLHAASLLPEQIKAVLMAALTMSPADYDE